MLKPDAFSFGKAISELWLQENICDRSADFPMDEVQIRDTRQQVREVLQDVSRICAASGLEDRVGAEITRFQAALEKVPLQDIAQRCDHLKERLLDELKDEFYFHVSRADRQYYGQTSPFGETVTRKFAAAVEDFEQAAKCLALQQATACVFHLMRGMETAVRRLARKLNMPINSQTTWRQLTNNMDVIINNMPQTNNIQRQKRSDWQEARVNLHYLGGYIRNNTMHPTSAYRQDEARQIFNTVGVSMRALCRL